MNNIPTIEETKELKKKHDEFYAKARYKKFKVSWSKEMLEQLEKDWMPAFKIEETLVEATKEELKKETDVYDGIW